LEGEQDAELPVVLVEVLLPGGPGPLEVGPPAGRDEAGRCCVGDVPAAVGVHRLQQLYAVEHVAGCDARGERQRGEDLRRERADVGVGRLDEREVPTVTR